ncbi:MAG: glucose-1-phosphate thymidylyltransferase RfbA [bacterium]
MKGIILAGGSGTRLHPITIPMVKQLLPIYNKPMIYYPLATLMLAGVREVLVISTPRDTGRFRELLGDGSRLGIGITYASQAKPRGIAEALIIGRKFIDGQSVWLILGDNIFFGHGLPDILREAAESNGGATVFGYRVSDPERYGVVKFDGSGTALSIQEKPKRPKSDYAVTGLYLYDPMAPRLAASLKPSARGELEITDLNNRYLAEGRLRVKILGRGYAWLDTGTYDSLLEAAEFVRIVEKRQSQQIACVEEIAYRMGYIGKKQLAGLAAVMKKTSYGKYLSDIANET